MSAALGFSTCWCWFWSLLIFVFHQKLHIYKMINIDVSDGLHRLMTDRPNLIGRGNLCTFSTRLLKTWGWGSFWDSQLKPQICIVLAVQKSDYLVNTSASVSTWWQIQIRHRLEGYSILIQCWIRVQLKQDSKCCMCESTLVKFARRPHLRLIY